ncbi:hypothetical protein J31TS4_03960 [Paenibacillus sp. J31TS4]|nr:hypothetical protein J31TS4_03960 [Paenibacillus sp. J31TS4]
MKVSKEPCHYQNASSVVYHNALACKEGGVARSEEREHARHILRRPGTPERHVPLDIRADRLRAVDAFGQRGSLLSFAVLVRPADNRVDLHLDAV